MAAVVLINGVVAVMVIVVIWEWQNENGSKNGDSKTAEQHNRIKANVINLFPYKGLVREAANGHT